MGVHVPVIVSRRTEDGSCISAVAGSHTAYWYKFLVVTINGEGFLLSPTLLGKGSSLKELLTETKKSLDLATNNFQLSRKSVYCGCISLGVLNCLQLALDNLEQYGPKFGVASNDVKSWLNGLAVEVGKELRSIKSDVDKLPNKFECPFDGKLVANATMKDGLLDNVIDGSPNETGSSVVGNWKDLVASKKSKITGLVVPSGVGGKDSNSSSKLAAKFTKLVKKFKGSSTQKRLKKTKKKTKHTVQELQDSLKPLITRTENDLETAVKIDAVCEAYSTVLSVSYKNKFTKFKPTNGQVIPDSDPGTSHEVLRMLTVILFEKALSQNSFLSGHTSAATSSLLSLADNAEQYRRTLFDEAMLLERVVVSNFLRFKKFLLSQVMKDDAAYNNTCNEIQKKSILASTYFKKAVKIAKDYHRTF